MQVEATDADSGQFGTVRYSIQSVSNDGGKKFAIDGSTGEVFVTERVDRKESYVLTIKAEDQAPERNRRYVIVSDLTCYWFKCSS